MEDNQFPSLPRWPFFLGDGLLVLTGLIIAFSADGPLTPWQFFWCVISVMAGALICIIPYILEFKGKVTLLAAKESSNDLKTSRDLYALRNQFFELQEEHKTLQSELETLESSISNSEGVSAKEYDDTPLIEKIDKSIADLKSEMTELVAKNETKISEIKIPEPTKEYNDAPLVEKIDKSIADLKSEFTELVANNETKISEIKIPEPTKEYNDAPLVEKTEKSISDLKTELTNLISEKESKGVKLEDLQQSVDEKLEKHQKETASNLLSIQNKMDETNQSWDKDFEALSKNIESIIEALKTAAEEEEESTKETTEVVPETNPTPSQAIEEKTESSEEKTAEPEPTIEPTHVVEEKPTLSPAPEAEKAPEPEEPPFELKSEAALTEIQDTILENETLEDLFNKEPASLMARANQLSQPVDIEKSFGMSALIQKGSQETPEEPKQETKKEAKTKPVKKSRKKRSRRAAALLERKKKSPTNLVQQDLFDSLNDDPF